MIMLYKVVYVRGGQTWGSGCYHFGKQDAIEEAKNFNNQDGKSRGFMWAVVIEERGTI